ARSSLSWSNHGLSPLPTPSPQTGEGRNQRFSVSANAETSLRYAKTEIGKWQAETHATRSARMPSRCSPAENERGGFGAAPRSAGYSRAQHSAASGRADVTDLSLGRPPVAADQPGLLGPVEALGSARRCLACTPGRPAARPLKRSLGGVRL